MRDMLNGFYSYICENTPSLRNDPEYQRVLKAYEEIEKEVKEKIGDDLLSKYQCAEGAYSHLWELAVFRQTIRYCHYFMLEVLR